MANTSLTKQKAGRPAKVTAEVVQRVGERVGIGVPLHYALLLEKPPINGKTFERALERNPSFAGVFKAQKADFLEKSFKRLAKEADWKALVTLLERRHGVDFAKQAEIAVTVNNETRIDVGQLPPLTDDQLLVIAHAAAKQLKNA